MRCTIKFLLTLCALCIFVEALEEGASKQLYSFSDHKGFSSDGSSSSLGKFANGQLQKSPSYYIQENASSYAPQRSHGNKPKAPASGSDYKQPSKNKYGSSYSKPKKDFKPNTRTSIVYGRKFAESLGLLR